MTKRDPFFGVDRLDDYVTGTMPDAEADDFEAELFAAAAKGEDEDARWFERFLLMMGEFCKDDFLIRGATAEDVAKLSQAGAKVHMVDFSIDEPLAFEERHDVDIIVSHLPLDVREYDTVEVVIERPSGEVLHTFRDCLGDPKTGHLYAICAAPLANMAWGGGPRVARVTGVKRGEESRQELAVYRLEPART